MKMKNIMKMKKHMRYVLLVIGAAAMLALSGCMLIPVLPTGVVEGHVTRHGAGEPVIGATVSAWTEDGEAMRLMRLPHILPFDTTDDLGRYRLILPKGSTYTVRVVGDGFATSIAHGVEVGSTARLNFIQKPVFNPAWSLEPPEITLTGVAAGDKFGVGPIDFRVDVTGDNNIKIIYVALGKTPGAGFLTAPRSVYSDVYTTGDTTIDPAVYGVEGWTTFEVVVYDWNNNRTHLIRRIHIEPAVGPPTLAPPTGLTILAVTLGDRVEFLREPIIVPSGAGDIEILTAPAGGNLFVELDWILSPDDGLITGYRIYRMLAGETDFTPIGHVARGTTAFRDSIPGLRAGLKVYYKVLAFSGDTESAATTPAATTPLDRWDVRLLTPYDGATGVALNPTFTWEPTRVVAPDKLYMWVLLDLAHGGWLLWEELLNETTYTFTGIPETPFERLQPHRMYQWTIWAAVAFDCFDDPTAISIVLAQGEADLFTFTTGGWPH